MTSLESDSCSGNVEGKQRLTVTLLGPGTYCCSCILRICTGKQCNVMHKCVCCAPCRGRQSVGWSWILASKNVGRSKETSAKAGSVLCGLRKELPGSRAACPRLREPRVGDSRDSLVKYMPAPYGADQPSQARLFYPLISSPSQHWRPRQSAAVSWRGDVERGSIQISHSVTQAP